MSLRSDPRSRCNAVPELVTIARLSLLGPASCQSERRSGRDPVSLLAPAVAMSLRSDPRSRVTLCQNSSFPRKPAPDLIRGGNPVPANRRNRDTFLRTQRSNGGTTIARCVSGHRIWDPVSLLAPAVAMSLRSDPRSPVTLCLNSPFPPSCHSRESGNPVPANRRSRDTFLRTQRSNGGTTIARCVSGHRIWDPVSLLAPAVAMSLRSDPRSPVTLCLNSPFPPSCHSREKPAPDLIRGGNPVPANRRSRNTLLANAAKQSRQDYRAVFPRPSHLGSGIASGSCCRNVATKRSPIPGKAAPKFVIPATGATPVHSSFPPYCHSRGACPGPDPGAGIQRTIRAQPAIVRRRRLAYDPSAVLLMPRIELRRRTNDS